MMVSALLLLTAWGAVVEMDLAPDQPVPHVYVDDPLIIEFRTGDEAAGRDVQANVDVTVESDSGVAPGSVSLGQLGLRAHGTHWQPIEGIPKERGRYRLKADMSVDGVTTELSGVFCRIDRPTAKQMPALGVHFDQPSAKAFLALKAAAISRVRFSAGSENLKELVTEAAAKNLQVILVVDTALGASCETLAKDYDADVVSWDVDFGGAPDTFASLSTSLRKGGAHAPIRAVVRNPGELSALLATGSAEEIDAVVWAAPWPGLAGVRELQAIVHASGSEELPLDMLVLGDAAQLDVWTDEPGLRLAHATVEGLLEQLPRIGIAAPFLYTEEFGPGYALVCAMAQRLGQAVPVGFLVSSEDEKAAVFRRGDSWVVSGWSPKGGRDLTIGLGDAVELALYDARNNPMPVPSPVDGNLMLALSPSPLYLVGKGGNVMALAAHNAAKNEAVALAAALAGDSALKSRMPGEPAAILDKLANAEPGQHWRVDFLGLIGAFPAVEELWHNGGIPPSAAATLLAGMTCLARDLCVVEQERGEAFVEPLQKTLANCGQSQSLYLTSSSGTSEKRGRPDWLFDKVTQLMEEAERLSEAGRGIEACAVAALAQARARGLEVMTRPKPVAPPQVVPQTPPQPTATPEPAPAADAAAGASDQPQAAPVPDGTKAETEPKKEEEPKQQSTRKSSKKNSRKK